MKKHDRVYPPYLRAWMAEQAEGRTEDRGLMFVVWLLVVVLAGAALMMTGHHEQESAAALTREVDRVALVRSWNAEEDFGAWAQRELFVMREARNSGRMLEQLYARR